MVDQRIDRAQGQRLDIAQPPDQQLVVQVVALVHRPRAVGQQREIGVRDVGRQQLLEQLLIAARLGRTDPQPVSSISRKIHAGSSHSFPFTQSATGPVALSCEVRKLPLFMKTA
jgi:hypothetical protein